MRGLHWPIGSFDVRVNVYPRRAISNRASCVVEFNADGHGNVEDRILAELKKLSLAEGPLSVGGEYYVAYQYDDGSGGLIPFTVEVSPTVVLFT